MRTVFITIGRNVGDVPMPPHRWDTFRDAVTALVDGDTFGTFVGVGHWDGAEDTFGILGTVADIAATRRALATLATIFEQDAIGCTAADGDTLVHAMKPAAVAS